MPETLDPNEVTNVGDPRTEERLSLKPFSQWKAESQATGNQLSDLDSLVGYSNYQRLESLKSNKYSIEAEKQIQSALASQIEKRGILKGKTEEERTQLEDSIFGVPDPSFDESVLAVSSAYPSATPDSPDPDLAAFARYRDFSRNIGEEVGQNDQAVIEELKVAATPAIAKLYDKAQRERVKNGDIPIAIVTNYDEEGKPYKSFYAEDTGDTPAEVAVARALETGAIPPQAAFGAYSTLQKVPGLNVNQIGMRNIQRVKSIASKASTFDEYSGLQDVINDYGDYLIDKEKGDVDAEDETFARQTEARFASYLGMITEDSEEKPTGQSVKQALEELAFDRVVQNGKVSFDEDNLSNNIRFSSAGVPLVHPALVGNSEYFDKALETKEGITAAQKKQLQANRKTFLASNFDRYDDLLSDSPTQGEDWRGYRNKARAEGRNDFEIIDSYLKNPNSFREFSSRMSGIGSSIIDAFGTLGATIPALAGAEWAQDYLTETAKKNSARRQVAEAFGRPFGIGQDILEQAAPIVADLAATALLSSVTGGAGGAAYLALRQGGNVTGKAVGKALTASMLQRSVFMEAGEDVATAAARLTDVGDLIKKGTSAADAERVISGYNRFVQSKLNLAAPLFLTSANRSAGGMYGAVYNSLPDTLSKEEKHDQALGASLMAGATTGLITSAFSLAGLGGLENALLKGATAGQLIKALRKVGGPKAVEDIGEGNFKAALAKGMTDTFAKLGLTTAARAKNLAMNVGSEAAEEGLDEFVSTFINDAFTGQDTPLLKRLQTGLHAAFIGGVYGGAIPGIKSAVKAFTPTTQTEEAAFAGARSELAQSVASNLEAAGSPLAAQAVSEILSADVVSSVLAAGPSAIGKSGTAFAGMTRAQAVERLLASAATTASQGDQLVMGSILRDAEGTRPAPGAAPAEEAPPSPSPEQEAAPAAAAPAAAAPAAPATPTAEALAGGALTETVTPTPGPLVQGDLFTAPGSAQAVADLTAAVPVLDLEEAAESEMTQGVFDFFDDASSVRTAVVPKPSAIEGVQRGLPSVPKGIPAPENDIQRKADDLRFIPEEAQQFKATLGKAEAKKFQSRLNKWAQVEGSLARAVRHAFKYNLKPTLPFVQDVVTNSGVAEVANSAGVTIVYADGYGKVSQFTGKPPVKTGKIAIATVTRGAPIVVVDESTVRGKSEEEIVESIRSAIFHASMIRAAAETGAYTSEPVSRILEENGLLGKASSANRSVSQSATPAEQLSKTVFAVANSEIDLNLNEHPTLRAFLEKVLPVLSFRLKGTTPDAPLSQAVENLQTLLEEGEVTGTVTPAPAPALSPASPKLQPRFVYGEDPTMTEEEKLDAAYVYAILLRLNAIPRNLEIIFVRQQDLTEEQEGMAFWVSGGYFYVNAPAVTAGLEANNLLARNSDGAKVITNIPLARQVLRTELDHEQIHMAFLRAFTLEERSRLYAGYTTQELIEFAPEYLKRNKAKRDIVIAILSDEKHPKFAQTKEMVADEKFRADVQKLVNGETSEESLAALSENTERKSLYMRYLTKAQFMFRKKLRASGDAAYSAALKRVANVKRDMQNGYIPAQHSHGGIFSPDRPYAGLSQIMRAGMYMNPNEDLPEDLDLDALEVEPGEDVIEVPVNEASLISDEEAAVAAFSMFGVGAKIENPETTKSKVLGGATVGTRYPKGTKLKAAAELGVNPDNQITLEAAAADKKSYLKNALVLASYPAVQGTIRRQLKDAAAVDRMRGKMTPAQWKVTSGKIKTALKKAKKILKSADEFKQTQRVVDALIAREDAKKELNAFIEGLSSNKNPNNPDNNARDAYWSWFFDQINFTGKGVLTPNKFGKSSLPKVRDALINFIKTDQIAALNESYTPVEGLRKWTPTKKDLQKVLTLSNKREKATLVTDKINVEAKEVRTKIGKDLDFFSAPDEEGSLVDDDIARIIYQSLDEIGEQNLTVLHDIFPESVRIYAKLWYDGANILARQLSGTTAAQTVNGKEVKEVDDVFGGGFIAKAYNERALEKAAAILAVFSPQKDWFMNVSLAHRTMEILSKALTRSSKMTWTPEMSAQFRRRAGEPEEIDDGNGNITFSGGAIPVYKEGTDNEFVLNEDGSRKFINFDPGKSIAAAEAILRAVEGKNFSDIGDPKKTSATYEDPDKKGVMKTISGTALQARFVRMFSEVYHAENYPAINPNGQVGGYAKSPDSGKNIKIAWGGYNTIEKAIRIYTAVGASENYEKDAILNVISNELGGQHKVRSFYNNIVNPAMDGHVTMDTHAIAAILGKPLSGAMAEVSHNFGSNFVGGSGLEGISGTYAANAESYRNVAFKKELRARELQSITWESVRLLFPAKFKRTKGVARINAIWEAYAEETEFIPEPTESDPNPAPVLINTIEDAWNQIIRVVWANTKKGKPVPTLTQLKEYAKIEYLNSVKPEDYNGLGFPSWDTTDIAKKMIALEGEKAVEDVISQQVDIGAYLNDTSSRYSQFGGPSASEQSERDLLSLLRVTKAEGIPIVRTNAALRRGIENLSTRIEGETTDEILEAAVKAKMALAAYGYHGTKIGYSDYTALLPATEMDPALAPSKFGPLEPSFIDFFAKAPALQSAIRNNPFGFTLNKEGESQLLGYVVAPRKNTEKILSEGFTDDDLRAYIVEHADILSLPGARIGGWFTPETNQFTLDVSFPVEKAEDALTAALAADQDAIWDLQNGYGINTKIKNPDGTYSQTPTLPRVIDGRDANRVIAEVVPTIGDVALFASERAYRDTGRMVLPSDGGPETTGAAAGLDVPTSRIIAEAREVNLSESAPGGSIQGGFGRTQRKGQEGSFGYLTGRFRKITASQAREKMSGYEYTGGEHIVKLDSASTSRVFKYARFADKPFGLPVNTAKTPQAGYLSRMAFGNIFFEDNQRIENVVEDETTGSITGYVVSQPYYSKSRNLSPDETRLILATLGWRKHPRYGQNVYLSQPVRLKDGSEGPRLYLTDVQGDNLFMENTEDGGEILRAPDLIVGVWSDDPAVRDMFPSVAELLELHPDPKEFGISVPSQLDGILAEDKDTADKLKQLKKDAEEEAAMFADLLGAMSGLSDSSTSGSRFSQFGAAQDAEYLALAADPVKNKARLQEMVDAVAKAAGYNVSAYHGTSAEPFTEFDPRRTPEQDDGYMGAGSYFHTSKKLAEAYGEMSGDVSGRPGRIMRVFLSASNPTPSANTYGMTRQEVIDWTDERIEEGFDSATNGQGEWVVYSANQIKSADPVTYDKQGNVIPLSQRFDTGSNDIRYSQFGGAAGQVDPSGFYSKMERVLDSKIQGKQATADQIKAVINNPSNGIKPDEIKWTGVMSKIDSLAAENNGKVPKAELLEFLVNEGAVRFEEVTLGGKPQRMVKDIPVSEWAREAMPEQYAQLENATDPEDKAFLINLIRREYQWRADSEAPAKMAGDPKYAQYVLPNGENYREVVLAMPSKDRSGEAEGRSPEEQEAYERDLAAIGEYKSSHFPDIPNYVAHMRLNERVDANGNEGLFIEELQSDRHQAGRKFGYRNVEEEPQQLALLDKQIETARTAFESADTQREDAVAKRREANQTAVAPVLKKYNVSSFLELLFYPEGIAEYREAQNASSEYLNAKSKEENLDRIAKDFAFKLNDLNSKAEAIRNPSKYTGAVADAPFRKDWSLALFKRALRDAVASGKNWIGWTVGDTQNDRFDLSKQVEYISHKELDGYGEGARSITIKPLEGNEIDLSVNGSGSVISGRGNYPSAEGKNLEDIVGKDVSIRILQNEGETGKSGDYKILRGDNLKVGGSGMRGFYDDILVKELGKYVKQWGAKVEKSEVEAPDTKKFSPYKVVNSEGLILGYFDSRAKAQPFATGDFRIEVEGGGTPIWRIDITPEMSESVGSGQILYSQFGAAQDAEYQQIMSGYAGTPRIAEDRKRKFSPIIRDLLNRREAGEAIPEYVLQRAVKEYFPSERVDVKKALAKLPSQEAIFDAIDLEDKKPGSNEISQKLSKHLETMKRGGFPKPGTMIEVRQDVPAMYKHGIGVVTLTFGKDNGLYLPIVRFLNPIFKPRTEKKAIGIEKATLNIGMGAGKAPLITIIGEWTDDQSIPADLDTWTQVGFNPDRHSYYYERGTERQVIGGEEAVQIGNTVFVKGAIILPEGELQGTPGIRYSQFGYTGKQELLDRHKEYNAEEDTSYFADFLDVMELAIFESGTYKSPVRFLERLFEGEFDPRYQRIKQTERAFSVAAASFIDQERQALLEEVEKAYGSSTDIAANSLISQAFGSTALPLSVEEVTALREAHKKRHLAAIAAATPEAVEARAQTLIASGMDALDAKIEAKNAIIREGVLKADQDSLADEIKARKVHTDKIIAAKNSALKKLEQQAPEVRRRVLRIRGFVDEQSRRISKNLGDNDPLRIVLDNQLGIYVTRSYQFFNDEGYRDAIMDSNNKNYMTYEAERQLARKVFQDQYLEARTLELMEEEFGLDEDGAKQQAQAEIDARAIAGKGIGDELMLRWLNSLTGGAVPEATMRPQGRDDASMRVIANNLRQRKDVPEPLRKLLKELDEEQGIERIIRTATTVSAIFGNQKTLSNVYKWGRANDNPDDRWLLTRDEFEALEASDYEKSLTYKPIPVKNGGASIRNPLAGHYAPVALTEALDNLSTKEHVESQRAASQRAINGAMDFAVKATGFSMAFNVLFSLGHYARNILGYTATAIGTGRPSLIFKSAPSLKRELGYVLPKRLQSLLSAPNDKFNVERLRLVALNIDNDSVNAGTLKDMLSGRVTLSDAQDQLKSLSDQARSAVGSAVQPIMDKLGELEAATETFFKIAYFYDTLETLEQARAEGTGKIGNVDLANLNTETALYQEAARQTLMVLPSHSQTMPLVTEFTKSGFGLMLAPFLRFKSEMIRTPINNLKLATDEIKSGNSVLFKRGVARMSGMLSVLAGSAAIPTVVSAILGGIDREEDEALRKTMPKYLRDHSFFYFEFGGELKSIDLTYVNPYSGIGDAFSKLHRAAANEDPTAPIQAIATFFQNNFLDDQILAGAISALRENRDPTTGLPIYEDVDTVAVKAGKALKFLGLEAYGPRVLTDAIKVAAAAKEGVNAPGYEVKDIMMNGVMPFRIHTLDVPQQFRRYLYDHRQQYQRAGNKINALLAKKAIAPEDIPKAYNEMVHYKKLANEDLLRTALAFTGDTLKVPLADADAMMRDSGVSKERIANLNDRVMDRPIVSKDFVDKLLQIPGGRERGQILYDTIQRGPRYFDLDVEK